MNGFHFFVRVPPIVSRMVSFTGYCAGIFKLVHDTAKLSEKRSREKQVMDAEVNSALTE